MGCACQCIVLGWKLKVLHNCRSSARECFFVEVVGNSLVSMDVVVIIVNLCKTGRLTSLCAKHVVKNAELPD